MSIGFIALALFAGMCFAVQASVNANLAQGLGDAPIVATSVSLTVGTLLFSVVTLSRGGVGSYLVQSPKQRASTLAGGASGCMALLTTVFLTPRSGLADLMLL